MVVWTVADALAKGSVRLGPMRVRCSAMKRGTGGIAVVLFALFVAPFGGALSEAETTSALRVEVSGPPQAVFGSDGREHIEYDLIITNAFTADATLSRSRYAVAGSVCCP